MKDNNSSLFRLVLYSSLVIAIIFLAILCGGGQDIWLYLVTFFIFAIVCWGLEKFVRKYQKE